MVRAFFLTIVLTLMPVGAVAQLSLEPTLKVHPSPPLEPAKKPAELNVSCPCYEVLQQPVYQDGRVVSYQSVKKPTGTSQPQRCG